MCWKSIKNLKKISTQKTREFYKLVHIFIYFSSQGTIAYVFKELIIAPGHDLGSELGIFQAISNQLFNKPLK